MKLENINSVYFLGIGGIGMSALARYFKLMGKEVAGYDRTDNFITAQLQAEGIEVCFEDAPEKLPNQIDLVVYTPAIPSTHKMLNAIKAQALPLHKRSQVLGWITEHYNSVAVAGTHGKTSTSAMVAHIFNASIYGVNAFVGGTMTNYNSNFLHTAGSQIAVVEADEFDRSFLTLSPKYAIITNMDADHLDIYGEATALEESFNAFAAKVHADGAIFLNSNLSLKEPVEAKVYTYSITDEQADFVGTNIRIENGIYHFDLKHPEGVIEDVHLGLAGRHNVENAVAAGAVALQHTIQPDELRAYLATFKGVKRRFEYIIKTEELTFIDDYAHHPRELEATISSAREMFPGKKLTGIFQPHLFSRTRDFEQEFAQSLGLLDELFLLDIYPAREEPIEGITSAALLEKVALENKFLVSKKELVPALKDRRVEVLLTLGAGDIDKEVEPIKNAFAVYE